MGGGLLALIAGGFIGYHVAKKENSEGNGWSWCQHRHHQQGRMSALSPANPDYRGVPSYGMTEKQPQSDNAQIPSYEYAAFQSWKQQQQSSSSSAPPAQPNLTAEALKAGAMDNADKALDVLLAQIQGLKEKLASHRVQAAGPSHPPSAPASESGAGEYKLV